MMDALQMKVLGLPAWAWGAIIGVGVVGISYYRSRNAPADPNSADPNAAVDANGNPLDTSGIAGYNPTDASGDAGGYYPGPIGGVGGFNYATPAPAPNPNSRLEKQVQRLIAQERRENRKHHKHKRNRHGTSRVASNMRNQVNTP